MHIVYVWCHIRNEVPGEGERERKIQNETKNIAGIIIYYSMLISDFVTTYTAISNNCL